MMTLKDKQLGINDDYCSFKGEDVKEAVLQFKSELEKLEMPISTKNVIIVEEVFDEIFGEFEK